MAQFFDRWLLLLCLLVTACTSRPGGGEISDEGRSAAAVDSPLNAINRENLEPGLRTVQATDGIAGRESLIHRTFVNGPYVLEQVQLPDEPQLVAQVIYRTDARRPMPVIVGFPPGSTRQVLEGANELPRSITEAIRTDRPIVTDLFKEVVDRGVMVATVTPREIPWPQGRARWIWPTPDAAGVEFFITWARVAPWDFGPLIDYIQRRPDARADRIGYFGFSTTALIGYGLIANEPRINVAVLLGGAGDLKEFAAGWARNFDWAGKGMAMWPETLPRLDHDNPLLKAHQIAPKAILMMNGGDDRIIPIESARSFFNALLPHYEKQRDRLQLIVLEGEGHNWNYPFHRQMLLEWFDRFLIEESR